MIRSNTTPGYRIKFALPLTLVVGLSISNACASSPQDDGTMGAGGSRSGTGGKGFGGTMGMRDGGGTGSGGTVGAGAASGAGGSAGAGASADAGCVPHSGPPVLDPAMLPNPCCTGSHCLAKSLLDSVSPGAADRLADCPASEAGQEKCVPDTFIASGGKFLQKTCRSLSDAEGRCLSSCIPQVQEQASRLPKADCADGELCAPCYDPISGEDTSACRQGCDTGPKEPKKTFARCCNQIGICVPPALVPPEQQTLLGKDTCTGANELCAPEKLAAPGMPRPKSCYSFEPQHREGRCMAACIPQVQSRSKQLLQETCDMGELCAPCFDPIKGGSTGACGVNGDAPVEPDKGPFIKCGALNTICGTLCPPVDGRCVPEYLVEKAQRDLLLANPNCKMGEVCAPCVNPLDNMPTGACP